MIEDPAGQPLATRPAPVPHPGPARVAEDLLPAGVVDRHPLPTPAADDEPGQQRRPLSRSPLVLDPSPVLGDPPLVGVVLLPGDVRRDLVRDQGQVLIGRDQDPPRPPPSWLSAARVGLPPPEAVIPGVDRVVEDVTDGIPGRGAPLELAAIRAGVRPDPDADVVGDQVAEDFANRAEALELVEHHADDRADLLVGVEIEPTDRATGRIRPTAHMKTSPRATLLRSPCRIRPRRRCSSASDMIPVSPSRSRSL